MVSSRKKKKLQRRKETRERHKKSRSRKSKSFNFENVKFTEVEEDIREGIFRSVDHVNRMLAHNLPIGYDVEEDLWIVNDYTSKKKGHDIPIEIKIKYDPNLDEFSVIDYEFRGDASKGSMRTLEGALNERY